MPPNSLCTVCRQVMRLRLGRLGASPDFYRPSTATTSSLHTNPKHPFSTSRLLSASQATPKEYKSKPPPQKAVTKEAAHETPSKAVTKGDAPETSSEATGPGPLQSSETATRLIAKELHKRAPSVTETYVAYGSCEVLVKECARQAEYTIPQVRDKNVEVPQTKDKEDLGVGTGWWFESEHSSSSPCHLFLK